MRRTATLVAVVWLIVVNPAGAQDAPARHAPLGRIFLDLGPAPFGMVTEIAEEQAAQQWQIDQGPLYKSTPVVNANPNRVVDQVIFEGVFSPREDKSKLAIFSDDGCDVWINDKQILSNYRKGQHLPNTAQSLQPLNVAFEVGKKYSVRIRYGNTIFGGPKDIDGCTLFAYDGGGKASALVVDLQIHNGLEGTSGGQLIAEADEETQGAVTVANLNDTNGDGVPDNKQDTVKKVGPQGRDEIDLMKLVLKKPDPDKGGKVKLTVVSGKVQIWEKSTKETKVALKDGSVEFDTTALDKTLWVEATAVSGKLRDIVIELDYKGQKDTVKATALWVELKQAFRVRAAAGKDNAVPDHLDNMTLRNRITKDLDADPNGGDKALDGSHYGIGTLAAKTPPGGVVAKADTKTGGVSCLSSRSSLTMLNLWELSLMSRAN